MAHIPAKPRLFAYIRWSSDKQADGDSKRRQLEMARLYAAQKGLELRTEDILIDEGVSAFTGSNVTTGKLGVFLERVKAGKIPPGSILTIEAFDRLSRQAPLDSILLFTQIIQAGIVLVTLNDQQEYTRENSAKIEKLFLPLLHFGTSNQEPDKKQARLRSVWADKRGKAGTEKISRMGPGWLRPSSKTGAFHFEVIPERVAVVRSIFEQSVAGIGNYVICKNLNAKGVPSFKVARGGGYWCTSSLQKLLHNRAVLGEYQPHKRIDGKKIPEGEPILDYFPRIIDEDLFNRAAQSRRARLTRDIDGMKRPVGGRKGANFPNLFTGIPITCLYCGGTMYRKDRRGKDGTRFVCYNADRGVDCERKSWNYKHFETSFLALVREAELEELTRPDTEITRRSELLRTIESDKAKLSGIEAKMDDLLELAAIPKVKTKIADLEAQRKELVHTITTKEDELSKIATETKNFYSSRDEIKQLVALLQKESGDSYRIRAEVNAKFKSLVASIGVATVGIQRNPTFMNPDDPVFLLVENVGRFFEVSFTTGDKKVVYPDAKNPFKGDELYSSEPYEIDDEVSIPK
jgi:DNA invertase Pin-like site-specific DNA recombinase